jgi:hypothetical protein
MFFVGKGAKVRGNRGNGGNRGIGGNRDTSALHFDRLSVN